MKKLVGIILAFLLIFATIPTVLAATSLTIVGQNNFTKPAPGSIVKINFTLKDESGNPVDVNSATWTIVGNANQQQGKTISAPGVVAVDSTAVDGTNLYVSANIGTVVAPTFSVYLTTREYYDFDTTNSVALPADGTDTNGNKYCAGATTSRVYTTPYSSIQTASMAGYSIVFSTKVMATSSTNLGTGIIVTDGTTWLLTLSLVDAGSGRYYIRSNRGPTSAVDTNFTTKPFDYGTWAKLTVSMNVKNQKFTLWINDEAVATDYSLPGSSNYNLGTIQVRSNIDELNVCIGSALNPTTKIVGSSALYLPALNNLLKVNYTLQDVKSSTAITANWAIYGNNPTGISIISPGVVGITKDATVSSFNLIAIDPSTNLSVVKTVSLTAAVNNCYADFDNTDLMGLRKGTGNANIAQDSTGNWYFKGATINTTYTCLTNVQNASASGEKTVFSTKIMATSASDLGGGVNIISGSDWLLALCMVDNSNGKYYIRSNRSENNINNYDFSNRLFDYGTWAKLTVSLDMVNKKFSLWINDIPVAKDFMLPSVAVKFSSIIVKSNVDNFYVGVGSEFYVDPTSPVTLKVNNTAYTAGNSYIQDGGNTVSASLITSNLVKVPANVAFAIAYYENNSLVSVQYSESETSGVNGQSKVDISREFNSTQGATNRMAKVFLWDATTKAPISTATTIR